MAKKVTIEVEVNASKARAGFSQLESQAKAASARIQNTEMGMVAERIRREQAMVEVARARIAQSSSQIQTGGGTHQFTGKDVMGGKSRFGVASSMFVSVARDSAASLASGAPLMQVMAQQGPQVLQAVTMIGGQVMKWGLGIGAGVAALVGFHYLSDKIFQLWHTGGIDQEKQIASLDRKSAALKAIRAEQEADRVAAEKHGQKLKDDAAESISLSGDIGNYRAQAREAQEFDAKKRQLMVINRLREDEQRLAAVSAKSSETEFSGMEGHRIQALKDQKALAAATLNRVNAEVALKNMEDSGVKSSAKSLSISSDSLTSVGNFLGSGQGLINSIFDKQLDEARKANMKHDTTNTLLNTMLNKSSTTGGGTIEVPGS